MSRQSKVLVTGAAGGLALLVAEKLKDSYDVVGLDPRPLPPGVVFPGSFLSFDYRHRSVTELFRENSFEAMIHLGRVPVAAKLHRTARFNLNVLGTRHLLDQCLNHKVSRIVIGSTFHVYGAHPHNHLYISEDDPLLASQTFPEIVDSVEMDNISVAFSLKNPSIHTTILRPVNIIGSRVHNQISRFLKSPYCPLLLGYDPLQQYLYEDDAAAAILLSLKAERSGIYNVSGEGVIPYSRAVELAGGKAVWIPEILSGAAVRAMKLFDFDFPNYLIEFFKYPVVVSDRSFRRDFGFQPKTTTRKALESLASTK